MKFFIIYNKKLKIINIYKFEENKKTYLLSLKNIYFFIFKDNKYVFLLLAEIFKKSGLI